MAGADRPERVLSTWERATGITLDDVLRERFLRRAETRTLCRYDVDTLHLAFRREPKLHRAVVIARALAPPAPPPTTHDPTVRPSEPVEPQRPPAREDRGGRVRPSTEQASGRGTTRRSSTPSNRLGPTGFSGAARSGWRALVFDPHPERLCPACDRPEAGCIC